MLEESERKPWQEVVSKQNKRKWTKEVRISLLNVDSNPNPTFKTITDATDGWVKSRVTMVNGAAGHVTLDILPNVNFEHTGAPMTICRNEERASGRRESRQFDWKNK